jgi:D-3-phosphoglycerate dehydrogenase
MHMPRSIPSAEHWPVTAVVSAVHPVLLQWLSQRSTVHYLPDATQADVCTAPIVDADVVVLRSNVRIGGAELERMRRLRLVVRAGSGTDNLDLPGFAARGVELVTAGGTASAPAVAELAVQASMALLRGVPAAGAALADGVWDKNAHLGREINGSAVGVWGAGAVGSAVGELFGRLGAAVRYLAYPGVSAPTMTLRDLCGWADLHIMALPLRPATRHALDADVLRWMVPRQPALVNVGRWDLLDMAAVLAALDDGTLVGVAVDPIDSDHVSFLRARLADGRRRNLQLTPHLGAMTEATQQRVAAATIAAIQTRWVFPAVSDRGTGKP